MELRMYCAYNQTRECFLGLEVAAGDFSSQMLSQQGAVIIRPNEGLWLRPFRGLPDSGVSAPVDLIYLDKDCCVVELIESYPAVHAISPKVAIETVLVLPPHSIFSSVTRVGDQLILCEAEEMQHRLERISREGAEDDAALNVFLLMPKPRESQAEELTAPEEASKAQGIRPDWLLQESLPNSENVRVGSLKDGFRRRWLFKLRQSPWHSAPGLEAFCRNSLSPCQHDIRDTSSKGLYLVSDDHWYPGTLALMTLQDIDGPVEAAEQAIAVKIRVVRCGVDGVGVEFVVAKEDKLQDALPVNDKRRKEIEDFLRLLWKMT
ncbi:MAG: hypothetical protein P4K86_01185 [Terracidiphilus sp.]|nr:hypothetical protein [Terracidiphilus sp.]